jgi:hypothetical protein
MTRGDGAPAPETSTGDRESAAAPPPIGISLSVFLAALAALRLWLHATQTTSLVYLDVDDLLYLRQARALIDGQWLGPYDATTLVKSPGYALFLAAAHHLGAGRVVAEGLLSLLAAYVTASAFVRLRASRLLAGAAAACVTLAPGSLQGCADHAVREGIYGSQTILALALAARLLAPDAVARRFAGSCALGIVIGWLWLTREEGLWILPALGLLAAGLLRIELRRSAWRRSLGVVAFLLVPPAVLPLAMWRAVEWKNEVHYGVPIVCELRDPDYEAAVRAIGRVVDARPGERDALDPELYVKLFEVSPLMRELRAELDGATHRAPFMVDGNGQRTFNFFCWALRTAASRAGWHTSLPNAKAAYRQLAREIEAAAASGSIAAGEAPGSVTPRARRSGLGAAWRAFVAGCAETWRIELPGVPRQAAFPTNELRANDAAWCRRVLRESERAPQSGHVVRQRVIIDIAAAHRLVMPWMACAGALMLGLRVFLMRRHPPGALLFLALAAAICLVVRVALVAILEVYWFPVAWQYFLPFYALLPLGVLALAADLVGIARSRRIATVATGRAPWWRRVLGPAAALAAILALAVGLGMSWRRSLRDILQELPPSAVERIDFGAWRTAVLLLGWSPVVVDGEERLAARSKDLQVQILIENFRQPAPQDLELELEWDGATVGAFVQIAWDGEPAGRDLLRVAGDGVQRYRVPARARNVRYVGLYGGAGTTLRLIACRPVPALEQTVERVR